MAIASLFPNSASNSETYYSVSRGATLPVDHRLAATVYLAGADAIGLTPKQKQAINPQPSDNIAMAAVKDGPGVRLQHPARSVD